MEGSFSESALSRLPQAVQELDLSHRKVYIHLRLGKRDEDIARVLGITVDQAKDSIINIREKLANAGQLYLIEEPKFVSMHPSDDDEGPGLQFSTDELSIDKKLIIKEFISILRKTIDGLPPHQSRILRLRYSDGLSAKEILGFSRKINTSFIPGKTVAEINEQDIFYALNTTLKDVLKKLKERYGEESFLCADSLKYILEEVEI